MEIATLLTAIAALFTGIITLLTVLEMRKQRVVSHLPILKVLGNYSRADIDQHQNWNWTLDGLLINNYGKGVALDVKITWDVDIEKILKMLKKYDPHNIKDYSIKHDFLKLENSMHAIKRQSNINFAALPADAQSSNEIKIPSYLTAAFEKYITETIINRPTGDTSKSQVLEFEDFPHINIRANYKDINENEYVKVFSLLISISSISKGSENNTGEASVVFYVNEITT